MMKEISPTKKELQYRDNPELYCTEVNDPLKCAYSFYSERLDRIAALTYSELNSSQKSAVFLSGTKEFRTRLKKALNQPNEEG